MDQDKRSFTKTNSMATIVWAKILSLHSIKLHAKNQSFYVLIYLYFMHLQKIKMHRDSPSHWIFFGVCNSYTPLPPKAIATLGIPIYCWTSSYAAFCIILLAYINWNSNVFIHPIYNNQSTIQKEEKSSVFTWPSLYFLMLIAMMNLSNSITISML